jgi:hypothetical protein
MSGTLMYHTGSLGALKSKLSQHFQRRTSAKGKPEPTEWVLYQVEELVWLVVPAHKVPRMHPVLKALKVTEHSRLVYPQTHLRLVK